MDEETFRICYRRLLDGCSLPPEQAAALLQRILRQLQQGVQNNLSPKP